MTTLGNTVEDEQDNVLTSRRITGPDDPLKDRCCYVANGAWGRTRVMAGRPVRFSCQVRGSCGLDQNIHAGDELAKKATCKGLCPLLLKVS